MSILTSQVASSEYQAIADDALKDEDNGIWLACLPATMHHDWFQRFHWIRWLDRLAEQDNIVLPGGGQFLAFQAAWQRLLETGELDITPSLPSVLREVYQAWFAEGHPDQHQAEIIAWNDYVEAIVEYHRPHLTLQTLADYEQMLDRLAGSCFQVLPHLEPQQRTIARHFGVVDQFYNTLRDLYEDARQGVCYFPQEVLNEFGVTTAEILDFSCFENPGYGPLMQFWLQDYLPELRRRTLPFLQSEPMPMDWQALILWFIHRYRRIDGVMASCHDNFVDFAPAYWETVQRDLRRQQTLGCHSFRQWYQRLYHPQHIADFIGVNLEDLTATMPTGYGLLHAPRTIRPIPAKSLRPRFRCHSLPLYP
ncbi:squalene/phytoene synthase family protein [Leptolyngbya sp. PCC 6406]|uniref:squalene/phytoene synthase family protein n=1 Tax=Leptolyngbya sp. PCC 6406 TaxID=1173264 RepID=UPI0002ACD1BB|nr:squalene/phytoene synthase family protein [Leptolyngbya sp. PCC 6406]